MEAFPLHPMPAQTAAAESSFTATASLASTAGEVAGQSPLLPGKVSPGAVDTGGPSAERRPAPPAPGLPCLNRNICTKDRKVSAGQRKTAFALRENVRLLVERYGEEKLGFLTLTFADQVHDPKEAQRRFHSLRTHVLTRYAEWIAVVERQLSGAIHFHLLVVVGEDIKTGFDFVAHHEAGRAWNLWKNSGGRDFESLDRHKRLTKFYAQSATERLRQEWAFWRRKAPRYQFGRCELTPIRTNAAGISRYLGKYISKHLDQRLAADKGLRLVRYSGVKRNRQGGVIAPASNRVSCRFTWVTPGATLWRWKLGAFAQWLRCSDADYQARFKDFFGPKWAYQLEALIQTIRLPMYPSLATFLRDYPKLNGDAVSMEPANALKPRPGFVEEARRTLRDAWLVAVSVRSRREPKSRDFKPRMNRRQSNPVIPSRIGAQSQAAVPVTAGGDSRRFKTWMDYACKDD